MSKSVASNKFRKVDVDQYDTGRFEDDEEGKGDQQGPNEAEINNFLMQGQNVQALESLLRNPPVGASKAVKDKAVNLAIRIMTAFKSSEVDGAIKSLNTQLIDVLMKYIYRGFESPSDGSSASLLTWHEKTYAVGGAGCVVRVLTDRKNTLNRDNLISY